MSNPVTNKELKTLKSIYFQASRSGNGAIEVQQIRIVWNRHPQIDENHIDSNLADLDGSSRNVLILMGLFAGYKVRKSDATFTGPLVSWSSADDWARKLHEALRASRRGYLGWLQKIFGADSEGRCHLSDLVKVKRPGARSGGLESGYKILFQSLIGEIEIECDGRYLDDVEELRTLSDQALTGKGATITKRASEIGELDARVWRPDDPSLRGVSLREHGTSIGPLRPGDGMQVIAHLKEPGILYLYGIDADARVALLSSENPKPQSSEFVWPEDLAEYVKMKEAPAGLETLVLAVQSVRLDTEAAQTGEFPQLLGDEPPPQVDPRASDLVYFDAIDRAGARNLKPVRLPDSTNRFRAVPSAILEHVEGLFARAGWRCDALLVLTYPFDGGPSPS